MITPFPSAFFFAPAQDASEGSTERPASLRSDEVPRANEAVVGPSDQAWPIGGTPVRLSHVLAPKPAHAGSDGSPDRTFYSALYDLIALRIEGIMDGRESRPVLVFDARRELARERARQIESGEHKVFQGSISGAFGLDMSTHRCGMCFGRFPETGYADFFYEDETLIYIHVGCYREAELWAYDPRDDDIGGAA